MTSLCLINIGAENCVDFTANANLFLCLKLANNEYAASKNALSVSRSHKVSSFVQLSETWYDAAAEALLFINCS